MKSLKVALVVARAENGVIGDDGQLPWRMKSDLAWFKKVTLGKPVIMGRKTYESIGKALPGRTNIVLTRNQDYALDDAQVVTTLDAAFQLAEASATGEIAIIGGGEIYRMTIDQADRLYLTTIEADVEGDTELPDLNPANWSIDLAGTITADDKNDYNARMDIWDRINRS